jgi:hypothetical protein
MAITVPFLTPLLERAVDAAARPIGRESVLVLFNEKAGGVTAADKDVLGALLTEQGFKNIEWTDAHDIKPSMFAGFRKHDVFVVLGGDGTARAAAEKAPLNAPPLILLPGGTLNVLPRALYGDLAWKEALVAALERGEVKRLSHGCANGRPFYVAAIFGAPTLLARAREAVREGKPLAAWRKFRYALKKSFTRSIRARPFGGTMQKAEAIGVLCPSFSGAVEGDDMEWIRLDARHILDLARVSLRALGAGWRADPAIDAQRCTRGDIVSLGIIPATLDGEPTTFVNRVKITYKKRGPRVVTVPSTEAA